MRISHAVKGLSFGLCAALLAAASIKPAPADVIPFPSKPRRHVQPQSPRAYQASYESLTVNSDGNKGAEIKEAWKAYSDGQGRLRNDSADGKTAWIYNFPKDEEIILSKDTKTYDIERNAELPAFDDSYMKETGTGLGERTIDGYNCHGWHLSGGGASTWYQTDAWIGQDTDCSIESKTTSRVSTVISKLKSFVNKAPDKSVFEIPADYKKL